MEFGSYSKCYFCSKICSYSCGTFRWKILWFEKLAEKAAGIPTEFAANTFSTEKYILFNCLSSKSTQRPTDAGNSAGNKSISNSVIIYVINKGVEHKKYSM